MNEFDFIHHTLKPLASAFPGALGLADDAALFTIPEGQQLVVTKDAITQGVHYLGWEDPALIAKKLLRSNLSDLAAMGAAPYAYFLALALPEGMDEAFLARFAQGLAEDQALFGIHLAGGDTIRTHGSAVFSLTALGLVPSGQALRRSGAKSGDGVYASGTLGDAAVGLAILRSALESPPLKGEEFLMQRYLLPEPRLALGIALRSIANACMDISDGLVADAEHLAQASGVAVVLEAVHIPRREGVTLEQALIGGDDYELLFTVSAEKEELLNMLLEKITCIGEVVEGEGVWVLDSGGEKMALPKKGYQHF